jgi:hypothetical protein
MAWLHLNLVLVLLICGDCITTYLFLRKARDYGYPNWAREETSPVYRFFIAKYGLEYGIPAVAVVESLVLSALSRLLYTSFSAIMEAQLATGISFGIFYGILFISIHRNYYVYYKCPARWYNEKVLGKPSKHGRHTQKSPRCD